MEQLAARAVRLCTVVPPFATFLLTFSISLSDLVVDLALLNNFLTSTIPSEIGLLTNLSETFCRCICCYEGDILANSCLLLAIVGILFLDDNGLTRTIPFEISLLKNLGESLIHCYEQHLFIRTYI